MKVNRVFLAALLCVAFSIQGKASDSIYNPDASGGASSLSELSDVGDLSGAVDGDVLAYDGVSWSNAAATSTNYASVVRTSGTVTYTFGGNRDVQFDTIIFDSGGNFNTNTYTYTCPIDGVYRADAFARESNMLSNDRRYFQIFVDGAVVSLSDTDTSNAANPYPVYEVLRAGATFYATNGTPVKVVINPSTTSADLGATVRTMFSVYPISQ